MTINELLTYNLNRLCKDRQLNGRQLGELLGASKAHGYQLLKGKSGIGQETIEKLCEAWRIDQLEFTKPPDMAEDKKINDPGLNDQFMRSLLFNIEQLKDAIKGLGNRVDAQGDRINSIAEGLNLTRRLLDHYSQSGDLRDLKASGDTG